MILAVNTSTPEYSLSIVEMDGSIVSELLVARGKNHFSSLMGSLDFLFQVSDHGPKDLKAIAVAAGPGSFTGLRVGIAASKGLSHALNIPVIDIPSLDALASQIPFSLYPVAPVIDSRRGELFTAIFQYEQGSLVRKTEYLSIKVEEFPEFFRERTVFVGNNFSVQSGLIEECLGDRAIFAPPPFWNLKAGVIGLLALGMLDSPENRRPEDIVPIYLRPPDIRTSK